MEAITAPAERLRRVPQQDRSRQRLQQILAAADRLLVRGGVEALTTTRIAEEAGIPVSSVYKYFADRHAIVAAVANHYVEEFAGLMSQFAEHGVGFSWDELPSVIIDAYAALYRARPGHRVLWLGPERTDEVREADELKKRAETEGLKLLLRRRGLTGDDHDLDVICRTMILTGDAMLGAAFRESSEGNPRLIDEAKQVIRLYLNDCARTYGGPTVEMERRRTSRAS